MLSYARCAQPQPVKILNGQKGRLQRVCVRCAQRYWAAIQEGALEAGAVLRSARREGEE